MTRDFTSILTIFFALPSDLATLPRSGIAFQVLAMFQTAMFLVFGGGTSIVPSASIPCASIRYLAQEEIVEGAIGLARPPSKHRRIGADNSVDPFESCLLERVPDSDMI